MRARGATVLEVVIALSIVSILVGAALGGLRAQQISVAREWTRLAASRAAASQLEMLGADATPALREGVSSFTPSAPKGAQGTLRVRRVEAGLYEVTSEVSHAADGVSVRLVTLVAREAAP